MTIFQVFHMHPPPTDGQTNRQGEKTKYAVHIVHIATIIQYQVSCTLL